MSLANRLKQARKDKNLSQQELAKISDVHYSNIGRYERGDAQQSAVTKPHCQGTGSFTGFPDEWNYPG